MAIFQFYLITFVFIFLVCNLYFAIQFLSVLEDIRRVLSIHALTFSRKALEELEALDGEE